MAKELRVAWETFPDNKYLSIIATRRQRAESNRNRTIEWSFGIVGVLLAAAVAAPNEGALEPVILVVIAMSITVALTALATGFHAGVRGSSVLNQHLTWLQFPEMLSVASKVQEKGFKEHTIRLILQMDLFGAIVQSALSLYRDVLLRGPGYLYLAAWALLLYFLYDHPGPSAYGAWWAQALVIGSPLVISILIAAGLYRNVGRLDMAQLNDIGNCPVCETLDTKWLKVHATGRTSSPDIVPVRKRSQAFLDHLKDIERFVDHKFNNDIAPPSPHGEPNDSD